MSPKRKTAGQKAALTRKRRAAAKKAVATRKHRAAGRKAARLHHAVPMPQQLPQISVLPARYPDPWKIILQQQAQNVLCILAIRLLLAFALPRDLGGVPDPQLKVQFAQ